MTGMKSWRDAQVEAARAKESKPVSYREYEYTVRLNATDAGWFDVMASKTGIAVVAKKTIINVPTKRSAIVEAYGERWAKQTSVDRPEAVWYSIDKAPYRNGIVPVPHHSILGAARAGKDFRVIFEGED